VFEQASLDLETSGCRSFEHFSSAMMLQRRLRSTTEEHRRSTVQLRLEQALEESGNERGKLCGEDCSRTRESVLDQGTFRELLDPFAPDGITTICRCGD
jgi:hypothetical protein